MANHDDELFGRFVESLRRDYERKIAGTRVIVVLLGAGGDGLRDRRVLSARLREKGIGVIIPDDDLPADVSLSIVERDMLSAMDVDLAFVNVQSWGSAAEFAEFQADERIAPKLRILVSRKHHPLYGSSTASGYLTDTYMTHEAVYGHVNMYRVREETVPDWLPAADEIVLKLSERYRQWKTFRSK